MIERWPSQVLQALRKDWLIIVLFGLLLGIAGGFAGAWNARALSRAQLLHAPLPLREAMDKDPLGRMIAEPIRVRTIALVCESDATLARTLEILGGHAAGWNLNRLRRQLNVDIAIAEETPSETIFSPLIALTASAQSPEEAKKIVDAWANACVEEVARLRTEQHSPAATAFEKARNNARERLRQIVESNGWNKPYELEAAQTAYGYVALKDELARSVLDLEHPDLALFAEGSLLPPDRWAEGTRYALGAAATGLILACAASLFFRIVKTTG